MLAVFMKKDYLVSVPENVIRTNLGIEIYDKVKIVECKANNLKEVYSKYPNALKVQLKEKD